MNKTKMTVITDAAGGLVAAIQGHAQSEKRGDLEVGFVIDKGHTVHKIEVHQAGQLSPTPH